MLKLRSLQLLKHKLTPTLKHNKFKLKYVLKFKLLKLLRLPLRLLWLRPTLKPLHNGDRVRFGRVDVVFYTHDGFVELVANRVR